MNVLTIQDARPEDSGLYIVEAQNDAGTISQTVSVSITEQQHIVQLVAPTPTMKLEPVTVYVGGTISLKCQFKGQFSFIFL